MWTRMKREYQCLCTENSFSIKTHVISQDIHFYVQNITHYTMEILPTYLDTIMHMHVDVSISVRVSITYMYVHAHS